MRVSQLAATRAKLRRHDATAREPTYLTRNFFGRLLLGDAACTVLMLKMMASPGFTCGGIRHNAVLPSNSPGSCALRSGRSQPCSRWEPGTTANTEFLGVAGDSATHVVNTGNGRRAHAGQCQAP